MTWDHEHKRYTDAEALAAAIAGGFSKVVWKDASEEALVLLNRTSNIAFTDLDLTAYTSADAKVVLLLVKVAVDSWTSGHIVFTMRKNGTTPANYPAVFATNLVIAALQAYRQFIIGLDGGQIVEYSLGFGGTAQVDIYINVVGYIE